MPRNVFESLRHPWWTLAISAALTALMIAIMTAQGAPLKTPVTPRGIGDLELAGTRECAETVLKAWKSKPGGTRVAVVNTLLDFLFIPCYSTTLALICFLLARLTKRVSPLSMLFLLWGWLMWGAGILDVVENLCMLGMLAGSANALLARVAQVCATVKFVITVLMIKTTLLAPTRAC
jgi:hypothetical protein